MKLKIEPCYNLALRKTCRLINQFYQQRISPTGLKIGQFSILRATFFCKETNNKQLQRILVLNQTTLSRNLKPLIRDGLLKLRAKQDDKRVKIISLSEAGMQVYLQTVPLWEQAQRELDMKIGEQGINGIMQLTEVVFKKLTA